MRDSSDHQPLYAATRRLASALERLEDNLQRTSVRQDRGVQESQQVMLFERENVALREERDNLNAAIDQLKFQYNDLQSVASAIYGKLDDSVKHLTQILEN